MGSGRPSPPAGGTEPARRGALNLRIALALVVIVAVAGGVALLAIGGNSSSPTAAGGNSVKSASYEGSLLSPAKPTPPLSLRNYLGEVVNINQYRGKAVLVTFIYTHCPDVCPIITSNLRVAQNLMGTAVAARTQVIAVSVDPRGDKAKAVAAFLARHEMTGRMKYLIGSTQQLGATWKAWGVGSEQDAQQPQLVNHSGLVYGVSASGKVTTLYPANFLPQEIAHDARLLAST
jgi:protein SCO1/2